MSAATLPAAAARLRRRSLLFASSLQFACLAAGAAVSLVSVPLYLRLLGLEAVGLIGLHMTLQAVLQLLDFGLKPTVIRELARASAAPGREGELSDLARTFGLVFAAGAAVIGLGLAAAATALADRWVRADALPRATVATCLFLIAAQSAVLWLSCYYQSALTGLERLPAYSAVRLGEVLLGLPGVVGLVVLAGPRLEFVFGWQLVVATAGLLAYRAALRAALPRGSHRARFRAELLHRVRGYAGGVTGVTVTGLTLSSMDKVLLSSWLPLAAFGSYSIAANAAGAAFSLLVQPFFSALFPRYSSLAAAGEVDQLEGLYRLTVQILASLAVPAAVVAAFFSRDLVEAWTGDPRVGGPAAEVLPALTTGLALNTLMVPAFLLQLAHGWTGLGLRINLALLAIFAPALLVLTTRYGAPGAAANFAAMQGAYLLLGLPLTHARMSRPGVWSVAGRDLGPTLLVCLAGTLVLALIPTGAWPLPGRVGLAFAVGLALTAGCVLAGDRTRGEVRDRVTAWMARRRSPHHTGVPG